MITCSIPAPYLVTLLSTCRRYAVRIITCDAVAKPPRYSNNQRFRVNAPCPAAVAQRLGVALSNQRRCRVRRTIKCTNDFTVLSQIKSLVPWPIEHIDPWSWTTHYVGDNGH
ncbi:hypothetical protein EVAR_81202_1 [Eumeta japonica]|uniref:Uncharacterized protein n=1 Tax=Eumeta variegata TaxID=151549 RepID=A0A4C1V2B7_EUMVA|nr:hypothetical protein EVAR_81202_1 [Eumeta japonica]